MVLQLGVAAGHLDEHLGACPVDLEPDGDRRPRIDDAFARQPERDEQFGGIAGFLAFDARSPGSTGFQGPTSGRRANGTWLAAPAPGRRRGRPASDLPASQSFSRRSEQIQMSAWPDLFASMVVAGRLEHRRQIGRGSGRPGFGETQQGVDDSSSRGLPVGPSIRTQPSLAERLQASGRAAVAPRRASTSPIPRPPAACSASGRGSRSSRPPGPRPQAEPAPGERPADDENQGGDGEHPGRQDHPLADPA